MEKKQPLRMYQINQILNDSKSNVKDHSLRDGLKNGGVVKQVTERIDTNSINPQITGNAFAEKIAARTGAAGKALRAAASSPLAKKAALVLGGPAAMALSTASDAMASEDVGLGSDVVDPMSMSEDYRDNLPEEQLDETNLSPEEIHRWSKLRGIMK